MAHTSYLNKAVTNNFKIAIAITTIQIHISDLISNFEITLDGPDSQLHNYQPPDPPNADFTYMHGPSLPPPLASKLCCYVQIPEHSDCFVPSFSVV